jgi:hypothetical protein
LAKKVVRVVKKRPNPSRIAVAYGAISRARRRDKKRIRLDQKESKRIHSSSDPCWVDQTAAALYAVGVVVLEAWATTL